VKLDGIAFVAGLMGFFLGGYAVYLATDAQRTADDLFEAVALDDETRGPLFERITALEGAVQAQNGRIKTIQAEERQLRDKVREFLDRTQALEEWSRRMEATSRPSRSP